MSDKLHIALDLDDVVNDFMQGVIDSMYREFGVLLLKEDTTGWEVGPVKQFDWPAFGYTSWLDWLQTRDWLWATFPAIPGAIGGIRQLRQAGHRVECITSKPDWAAPQVWRWLGKWRPEFNSVTIVGLDEPKWEVSQADILVDDKPSTIQGWVDSAPDRFGVLYRQPWNDGVDLGERTVRAADWQQVLHVISLFEEVA